MRTTPSSSLFSFRRKRPLGGGRLASEEEVRAVEHEVIGARPRHVCQPPTIVGLTVPQQPDWTCAKCGRIWRDCRSGTGVQWWAEVRGPTHHPRGETL